VFRKCKICIGSLTNIKYYLHIGGGCYNTKYIDKFSLVFFFYMH